MYVWRKQQKMIQAILDTECLFEGLIEVCR